MYIPFTALHGSVFADPTTLTVILQHIPSHLTNRRMPCSLPIIILIRIAHSFTPRLQRRRQTRRNTTITRRAGPTISAAAVSNTAIPRRRGRRRCRFSARGSLGGRYRRARFPRSRLCSGRGRGHRARCYLWRWWRGCCFHFFEIRLRRPACP